MTTTTVKKTISLPESLAKEIETIAEDEGKTLSAVIQDALVHVKDCNFILEQPVSA